MNELGALPRLALRARARRSGGGTGRRGGHSACMNRCSSRYSNATRSSGSR
jgi:hypothetical protein